MQTKTLKSQLVQTCENIPQNTVRGKRISHVGKGIFTPCVRNHIPT